MAHFAEIDGTNTVLRVVVVHNDVTTIDDVEVEQRGIDFLDGILPVTGQWVQTSYNANFRHSYAGAGFVWDAANDVFYVPEPSEGDWVLNTETWIWESVT